MPENSQTIAVAGYDASGLQAIAYGAIQQMGWTIKYAGENFLLAFTPGSWHLYDDEITIKTVDNQLTVTSKMTHGEPFDVMRRTKKDIAAFLAAFNTVKANASGLNISEWNEKIEQLKTVTIESAEEELMQAEEMDKVMNLSTGTRYITYSIIAINIFVFVLMTAKGVNIVTPTGLDIIAWGGNFSPYTLSGDWWRLISAVFVHVGIIHLLFNMYVLYVVGNYLEPMLGVTRYVAGYLCTGVLASLVSLWWHKDPIVSAGASGAIFGMYGIFLALLSTKLVPKQIRNRLLQSIGLFIAYNLLYGLKSGVDNAAHIGGLISGLVIGYLYYPALRNKEKKSTAVVAMAVLVTAVTTIFYLQNNSTSIATKFNIQEEIEQSKYEDDDKYNEQMRKYLEAEENALEPFMDATITEEQRADKLKTGSLPEWEKAKAAIDTIKSYELSGITKERMQKLGEYIELRKEQIRIFDKWITHKDLLTQRQLVQLNNKIDSLQRE